MTEETYTLVGVYVSRPVHDDLAEYLYDEAGVVDLEEYFDPSASEPPVGDPGADATAALIESIVSEFASLYDEADFEAARAVDPDAFVLRHLAADPDTVANAREQFQAAGTIQNADLRTVHTAIFDAWLTRRGAR
ncbi:hypothetical protein [Natrarchaeobius chitinivorans]|uniref:Uncharacterized protein n=1 Tax=Natrarchaeobius chitinivorans TaxID=1679083 RepID=A0A3N6MKH9_NATCH|nr:hypothetical protein [Natrarchaeobius chitinivorans]RQG97730.1 hypothetical protein EA473_00475 [Natrarchaeobius chitinivorans]